jgi:hypothetical protein
MQVRSQRVECLSRSSKKWKLRRQWQKVIEPYVLRRLQLLIPVVISFPVHHMIPVLFLFLLKILILNVFVPLLTLHFLLSLFISLMSEPSCKESVVSRLVVLPFEHFIRYKQ